MKRLKVFATVVLTLIIAVSATLAVNMSVDELLQLTNRGEDSLGGFWSPNISGTLEATRTIAKTSITASTTLMASESGTTYFLSASGTQIILPAVANVGAKFRFVISGASSEGNYIISSAEGDNIEGSVIVAGAVVDCDDADQLNFVVDGENLGDYVEIMSDGTNWFPLSSGVLTASKLTCTG